MVKTGHGGLLKPLCLLHHVNLIRLIVSLSKTSFFKVKFPWLWLASREPEGIGEDIDIKSWTLGDLMLMQQKHLCNPQKYWSRDLTTQFGITYVFYWFNFCVPMYHKQYFYKGLCTFSVMRESCAFCEETQLSKTLNSKEMCGLMMVNVCACGPGQQHFPAGVSWPGCWTSFWSIEQLLSSDFKVELDGWRNLSICLWPTRTAWTHVLRREWVTEKNKEYVNNEQPF